MALLAAAACGGGGGGQEAPPRPPAPPPSVAMSISQVIPPQGSRDELIKIIGPGVGQATGVLFGTWYASFRRRDDTTLEAKVPYFATTGKLSVRIGGSKEAVSKEDFMVVPPGREKPVLDAVAPLQGAPGLQVTLTGTGLDAPGAITFGGVDAGGPLEASPTKLVVKVPPQAKSGHVVVATAGGTTESRETFTVLAPGPGHPSAHGLIPSRGPVGTPVLIHGECLQHTTRVDFAGTAAVLKRAAPGEVETQVPPGATAGPLTLADAAGHVLHAGTFLVTSGAVVASITSFEPETGPPGTTVLIKGPGVGKATEVWLGPLKCWRYPWSDDQLAVYLPMARENPASALLKLRSPDGAELGTPRPFNVVLEAPVLHGFSPSSGPAGTAVTVRGQHLDRPQDVWFGDVKADAVAHGLSGSFVVAVPKNAATGPVKVTTAGGTAVSAATFTVTPEPAKDLSLAMAYITQGSQRLDGGIPLVEGRAGIFRAFVQTSTPGTPAPSVRVTIRDASGTEVLNHVIPPPRAEAPTEIQEGRLTSSWNLRIPPAAIKPGHTFLAEVVAEGVASTFPGSGHPLALDVRELPPLELTLVPVRSGFRTGRVTGGGRTLQDWIKPLEALFPLAKVVVREAPEFHASQRLTDDMLTYVALTEELEVARLLEPEAKWQYRFGVFERPPGSGLLGYSMAFGTKGSSEKRTGVVYDGDSRGWGGSYYANTLVHELGHLMGRRHAPCGGASGEDAHFPHADAGLGAFGFDVAEHEPIDPASYKDIMSYCYPRWTSDYTYQAILDFHAGDPMPRAHAAMRLASTEHDCMVVWGRFVDGKLTLEPVFSCHREPDPPTPGDFRLVLRDLHGDLLGELPFEASVAPDLPPGRDIRSFAFVIPRPRGLATLEVVRDGLVLGSLHAQGATARREHRAPVARRWGPGKVHLSWDYGAHPRVLVKDPAGHVLAVGSGGSLEVTTPARELEVTLSDGIDSQVVKVPVGD